MIQFSWGMGGSPESLLLAVSVLHASLHVHLEACSQPVKLQMLRQHVKHIPRVPMNNRWTLDPTSYNQIWHQYSILR